MSAHIVKPNYAKHGYRTLLYYKKITGRSWIAVPSDVICLLNALFHLCDYRGWPVAVVLAAARRYWKRVSNPKGKPMKKTSKTGTCLRPDCGKAVRARGLCASCYVLASSHVSAGRTTWAKLENAGKCLKARRSKGNVSAWLLGGKSRGGRSAS